MKVEPFLVASTVNVIIAQRLIRKICDICKMTYSIRRQDLSAHIHSDVLEKHFDGSGDLSLYKGKGCKVCRNTGYVGRIGIFEVLEVTQEIRALIATKSDSDTIARRAVSEGMTTMLDDGLEKVKRGSTTIEEIIRVTKAESI